MHLGSDHHFVTLVLALALDVRRRKRRLGQQEANNGARFLAYVEQMLIPTLSPGEIVLMLASQDTL